MKKGGTGSRRDAKHDTEAGTPKPRSTVTTTSTSSTTGTTREAENTGGLQAAKISTPCGDENLTAEQRAKRDEMVASFLDADPENGIDVCFSFDTTGSMYCYLKEVRTQVEETARNLFKMIPQMRISIITHGDFCDDEKAINILDFTNRVEEVCRFIKDAPCTCGGDLPENYEFVLHKAYDLSWVPNHAKALVLIGDCEPHPPSYTDRGFNWRNCVERLFRNKGVKIYGCHCSPSTRVTPFYVDISRRSGGVYFTLKDFSLVTHMFKAVCYREYSIEQLRRYASEVTSSEKMKESMKDMFDAMIADLQFQDPPARLSDPWWDISLDSNTVPRYYSHNGDRAWKTSKAPEIETPLALYDLFDPTIATRDTAPSTTGDKTTAKPDPGEKTSPKDSPTYKDPPDSPHTRCKITEAEHHGANTRTGSRILETREPVTTLVEQKAARAAVLAAELTPPPSTAELFLRDGWIVKNGELIHLTREESIKYTKERIASLKITTASCVSSTDSMPSAEQPREIIPTKIKSSVHDAGRKLTPEESKVFATKRLMRDLKELERTIIYNVSARPLPDDIFVWHCNMGGPPLTPYSDVVFHLVIKFSIKYPRKPPVVNICTKLYHPNVFGCWVCLDMLENGVWDELMDGATFTGWSSGYSLTTILIQLQAFLFAGIETAPRIIEATRKLALHYKCAECGHQGAPEKIFPPFTYTTLPRYSKEKRVLVKSTPAPATPSSKSTPPTATPSKTETVVTTAPKVETSASPSVVVPSAGLPTPTANHTKKSRKTSGLPPLPLLPTLCMPTSQTVSSLQETSVLAEVPKFVRLEDLKPRMKVTGTVTNVKREMGVFVNVGTERDGLIPARLLTREDWQHLSSPKQIVYAFVESVNLASRRLYLTLSLDPLQEVFESQKTLHIKELEPGMELIGCATKVTEQCAYLDIKVVGDIPVAWGHSQPSSLSPTSRDSIPGGSLETSTLSASQPPTSSSVVIPTASLTSPPSTAIPTATFPTHSGAAAAPAPKPTKLVVTKTALRLVTAQLRSGQVRGIIVIDARDCFKPGMFLPVQVLHVDAEDCKIDLMCKPKSTPHTAVRKITRNEDLMSSLEGNPMSILSVDCIYKIFRYLSPIDITRLGMTCKFFHKLSADGVSYVWERNELVCFHSKRTYLEDTLGVGLNLENKLNGKLAYITTTFDLLSYDAFMLEKVRMAAYREPFTHWLPLYINKRHAVQAVPLAKEAMGKICAECYGSFEPWMVCEVIPKIMNSLVVQVMTGKLHASIMAIEGYCAFHHLFLMFLDLYPELRRKVDETIETFINDEKTRNKHQVPALGEWLPLLTVTETYSWNDVAVPYLHEMFDRNVLWTLKKFPQLIYPTPIVDEVARKVRLAKVFEATTVSNHLAMFHVYFLKHIGRPDGVSLAQVRQLLDIRYGRPTYGMKDQLQRAIKSIRQVKDWETWFQRVHVPFPGEISLCKWLNKALENSSRRHYHNDDEFLETARRSGFYSLTPSMYPSPPSLPSKSPTSTSRPPSSPSTANKKPSKSRRATGKGSSGASRHLNAEDDDGL
ncbi:Ubiquitinconjugating enzyme subfamily protein [Pelomyxa schiedti]|nr:Ubiquitinconjugating enzyme subfamily protein [Pelomyxa schiedti]